jgi:ATP-dependent helicase/nuclease subunit A
MSLTPQQQAAAYAPNSVAVTAGAGTGKTFMLVERYLYYLREHQLSPLEMVAVTFTEKAAKELRSRIRQAVAQQLPQFPDSLAELEAAQISTIHALASRICREHPEAAGVPPDFSILDDLEGEIWLNDRLNEALDKIPDRLYQIIPYSQLSTALQSLISDPISAHRALAADPQQWELLAKEIQNRAIETLLSSSDWGEATAAIANYSGKAGDKIEDARQAAFNCILNLENKTAEPDVALTAITQIDLRGGSKKNWTSGALELVKDALKSLKEIAKAELKTGLVTLILGAADDRLMLMLPALCEAFEFVQSHLLQVKHRSRTLTFADLEVHALQALQDAEVIAAYAQRYRVFLIDEFQDTNPIQAELLAALTQGTYLTIVGDVKQSIYGFRRADVSVFDRVRDRILSEGGSDVQLDTTFRTHRALISQINCVFQPLLLNLHQDLIAYQQEEPHPAPHLEVYTLQTEAKVNKPQRQLAEAKYIAQTLKQLLDTQTLVRDKKSDRLRPITPADIAILSRTWDSLQTYSDVLETAGIPAVVAGGESLLETREAKDAIALLRFLADPSDSLALVAVLRGPFFALSDVLLFTLAREHGKQKPEPVPEDGTPPMRPPLNWWHLIQTAGDPELAHPISTLKQLLNDRAIEPPTRLLQIADRLTGYTATIANLPGAARREADWRGFRELLRSLEAGNQDVFTVIRRLKRPIERGVKVPRLPLDISDAVSLMTIHASKGLEWPVVVVADLTRSRPNTSQSVYFDPELGVGLKWDNEAGESQKTVLYTVLEQMQKQREEAELVRVLYVALTRTRDRLLLTSCDAKGGSLDRLRPGLEAANIPIQLWPLAEAPDITPPTAAPKEGEDIRTVPIANLGCVTGGVWELPVTALGEYATCPKRFEFCWIQGHPGLREEAAIAPRLGTLVHKALERGIRHAEELEGFDRGLERQWVDEAIELALRFDRHAHYAPVRTQNALREHPVTLKIDGLVLNGAIDLLGEDWVLDFKTDREMNPKERRWQLWAYAAATERSIAHIAYLRHDTLYTFTADELAATSLEVAALIPQILVGNYTATPSERSCGICPYADICELNYHGRGD